MQNSDSNKPEILAPAGDFETLRCAVNCGADAVYVGMQNFSARAKAANFSREELAAAVEYAHFFGVKIYVAFNTLYKSDEYDAVLDDMKYCYEIGADALILQDFTLISRIKSTMPDIVLHLSTQAGVHNADGAVAAESMGFDRVILSREACIEDIREIARTTGIETEFFVQGALCVSFSGNCYFSSLASGFSGNRGKCMQLCRKKYVYRGKTAYWLSPKDICLANKIGVLKDAGVCSFKIEGRMRRPEYSGEAVNCYKTLLEGKKYSFSRITRMFNRGDYTDLYLENAKNNVIYPLGQNHIGDFSGRVLSVARGKATVSKALHKGDGVKFLRRGTETGGAFVSQTGNSLSFKGSVLPRDEVRVTTDAALNEEVLSRRRYVGFTLKALIENKTAKFVLYSGSASAQAEISDLSAAESLPVAEKDILSCFQKTEDYSLRLSEADVIINDAVFIPKSALNAVRRELCERLRKNIIASYVRKKSQKSAKSIFSEAEFFTAPDNCIIMRTDSAVIASECQNLYDYVAYAPRDWSEIDEDFLAAAGDRLLLEIPSVIRGKDREAVKKALTLPSVKNVIANNIGAFSLCRDKKILPGPLLNIINPIPGISVIMSPEAKNRSSENFVYYYGNFPLMTLCHCPKRTFYGKCGDCKGCFDDKITDENKNEFALYSYKIANCYCRLLNCVPVNLSGTEVYTHKKFVDLVGYDAEMCYNILDKIRKGEKIPGGTLAFYNKNLE